MSEPSLHIFGHGVTSRELTVKEYAAQERVTESVVRRWIAAGKVEALGDDRVVVPPEVVTPATRSGYLWTWFSGVYFIRCERFVKIGYAHDVRVRLNALQVSNPFGLEPLGFIQCANEVEAQRVERTLHQTFSELRERCEWFRYDDNLAAYVIFNCDKWPRPRAKKVDERALNGGNDERVQ